MGAAFSAPAARTIPAALPPGAPPMLCVVVDTEEEFDWNTPLHGTPHSLRSIGLMHRLAERARKSGVVLTCMATYPVLANDVSWGQLSAIVAAGDAVLGAHLHPWTTPPFGEAVTVANSFQGNLAPAQESAKVATMVEALRARTGQAPTLFKAGRSGVGPATAATLVEHGFQVDLSYMPCFTYERQGGPSFLDSVPDPFMYDFPAGRLLEIPDSAAYLGALRGLGRRLHPLIDRPVLTNLHVPGILSRLGLLERVPLTPEGITQDEARRLTTHLYEGGQRVFQLSFHSTSLVPGGTSYAPDEAGVTRLLDWLDEYVGFFRTRLGGTPATPHEVLAAVRDRVGA